MGNQQLGYITGAASGSGFVKKLPDQGYHVAAMSGNRKQIIDAVAVISQPLAPLSVSTNY